jgi:hypothetical protein
MTLGQAQPWDLALVVVCWVLFSVLLTVLWGWARTWQKERRGWSWDATAGHWVRLHADPHADPHAGGHAPHTVPTLGSTAGLEDPADHA